MQTKLASVFRHPDTAGGGSVPVSSLEGQQITSISVEGMLRPHQRNA